MGNNAASDASIDSAWNHAMKFPHYTSWCNALVKACIDSLLIAVSAADVLRR
jgi:hypothetical protein